jgi:hypothetical protein
VAAFDAVLVLQDLELIWENAILYNGDQVDVGRTAIELKKFACQALKRAGLDCASGALHMARMWSATASFRAYSAS